MSGPPIVTKANLDLFDVRLDTVVLDSSDPGFKADFARLRAEGYVPADGDNVASPDHSFTARTILTLVRST